MLKLVEENEILNSTILYSLDSFFQNDNVLLSGENGFHEQAISHRIAYYLEYYFRCNNKNYNNNLSFDCEYNKKLDGKSKTFNLSKISGSKHTIKYKDREFEGVEVLRKGKYLLLYIKEKNITIIREEGKFSLKSLKSSQIRPDIIIHKRLKSGKGDNFAVFEIKKGNLDPKDILKLKGFTSENLNFKYQYGIGLSNFNDKEETVNISVCIAGGECKPKFVYNNKTKTIEKIEI